MQTMIEHASYMAHGYCLLWQPWLVALWAVSDLLIFLSYLAIPIALILFLKRRPDLQARSLVALFAAFILLCGITHALSIVTLWLPIYPLVAAVKLMTGLVSAATALVLFRLIPKLVQIPQPHQLQAAIGQLQDEAVQHRDTMAQLEVARGALEHKVAERTAELRIANQKLSVLVGEALHRVKNLLGVVNSLARQTARSSSNIDTFVETFSGRIDALANATSAMTPGAGESIVQLETVVARQLQPIIETYGDRISIAGAALEIGTEAAQQIALAVHELATNAVKYGSLSTQHGSVDIGWKTQGEFESSLILHWTENAPESESVTNDDKASSGFGSTLLMRAVPAHLGGAAKRKFTSAGLQYEITVPVEKLKPQASADEPA